jgi:predicted ribosomally synthesized peptide with SipW-like signal peptide
VRSQQARHRFPRRGGAVLGALAALCVAAGLAGGGTFGLFTDPAASSPRIDAARIDISLATPGGRPVPFSGTGFYPGSSVRQDVALKNDGGSPVGGIRLTTSATSSNLLTSDPVNGLQLTLTRCSMRWQESGTSFSCGGTTTPLYSGPFLTDVPLTALGNLTGNGNEAHVLIAVTLPDSADNRFQGLSASLGLAFRAQQVEGRVR